MNTMIEIQATRKLQAWNRIKNLYESAFPKAEQLPIFVLTYLAKNRRLNLSAFYDDNLFVGLCFYEVYNDMIFVMFLAIDDKMRSIGYGSKILTALKEKYPNATISLSIEPVIEECDNFLQRKKRLAFYERNGYYRTTLQIKCGRDFYWILSTDPNLDKEKFRQTLKSLSVLYNPKLFAIV